jgi:hypothetical protein
MSRGWESKSVEEQQSMSAQNQPENAKTIAAADAKTGAVLEADRKRRLQALELQRERVLSERTSSPHRRSALENALADIEEKLAELGWTIHM